MLTTQQKIGYGSSSLKECIELLNTTTEIAPAPLDSGVGKKSTDPLQILTKMFTDRLKILAFLVVGNLYRCRLPIPLIFGSVSLPNLPIQGPYVSVDIADLPSFPLE